MKHYNIDDFLGNNELDTLDNIIDKKVSLLYDLCILHENDHRESALRTTLAECGTEHRMTTMLRDVIMERVTLDDLLAQKEAV